MMNLLRCTTVIAIAPAICLLTMLAQPAAAAVLGNGGWDYAIDSFDDSIQGNAIGGTSYEGYGIATKQVADRLWVAVSSNLPLEGIANPLAADGHTGWADFILNFSGQNLSSANGNLWGVRFAGNNASGVNTLGLVSHVSLKSVAAENGLLLNSLGAYNDYVAKHGRTPSNGDLAAYDPYFNQGERLPNVIASGTWEGEANLLSAAELADINFGGFGAQASHLFGFSVDRKRLPVGGFVAYLSPECANDVMAVRGETKPVSEPESVPEPTGWLGLTVMGLVFGGKKCRDRLKSAAV
uniref:XDD3 family exosortase-dependent surface protein n=1 Tax=Trichocoleus desertorum TaxID=1481672 RepID=UPI0025B2AEF3|nr:XDD3 family exosortase-dependent surface protein [Trichocoleus desertorum]